jgi:hypothetical protein
MMNKFKVLIIFTFFLTSLLFADIVLEEGFEGGCIPEDWSQEYIVGTTEWSANQGGHSVFPQNAHTGDYNAFFFYNDESGNSTKLITPELNLNTEYRSVLKFWHAQDDWAGCQDVLHIYYKTSVDGEWILLESFTSEVIEWTERTIFLPDPGPTYYIAFEGVAIWGHGVCVDDVMVLDSVINTFVWDNDNYSTIINQGIHPCEEYIEEALEENYVEYETHVTLPTDLSDYDVVLVVLGVYCVG